MISLHIFPLLFAGLAWQPACADLLYKWVDSAGHVTYSSLPPPAGTQAEKVQGPPQPSAEAIRQAEEQVKRTQELAREMEDQRRKQEAEEAEEARLRAMQSPPAPVVIEQPVYMPYYYPSYVAPLPRPHPDKPPRRRPRPALP